MIISIVFLQTLWGENSQIKPPPKDPSKEYHQNCYFHYDFYVDDAGEDDSVKAVLKLGIPYEGDIGVIIDELTRVGSTAVDIGAHIGVHTITMSKKVGPYGKVIAFEPNKKLCSEQLYNLELNGCKNVTSICKAAGAEASRAYLQWGKIDPVETERGYFVDVASLDSLHLENVSLIKMDVENYEYPVLLGAKETILKSRPIIIFECWLNCKFSCATKEAQKANFVQVASLLESMGYEVRPVHCCNFIAFPKDIEFPFTMYREKFPKLDMDHYDPDVFVAPGMGMDYYRSWTSFE